MKHTTQPQRETKIFTLAAPDLSENSGAGAASVMGLLDQADDVIFPGFWTPVLADFLTNGFVPVGHDWSILPVGFPTKAEERGADLYAEWTFHSTQAAQDARTVAKERIAAGKSMGLSVGFVCASDGIVWFKNGAALLEHAEKQGYNLSLFDVTGLRAHKTSCRALVKCAKLYEFSIVPAPCNTAAVASDVKGETPSMRKPITTLNAALLKLSLVPNATGLTLTEEVVDIKGEALGNVEQDASMAAIRTVISALSRVIYQTLYNPGETITSVDDLLSGLPAAFDEARDMSLAILQALLANVDIEDLQDDLDYWYYYYSAPPGEQAALTFAQKAAHLETDVAAFITLATRRQEARVKDGRKLSQATREKMQAIRDGLKSHCDSLETLLADTDMTGESTDEAKSLADVPAVEATAASHLRRDADRLLQELQALSGVWHSETE